MRMEGIVGGLAGAAMLLAGCSAFDRAADQASPGALDPSSENVFHEQLYWAEQGEASEKQLAALEEAARTGDMSFETVSELVEDAFACLEEVGIGYVRKDPERVGPSYLIPSYAVHGTAPGMTAEQAEALGNECLEKNSYYAEGAYQLAPRAVSARDDLIRAQLPQIVECLNDNGVAATEEETLDELTVKVIDLLRVTSEATNGEGAVACSWDMVSRAAAPQT